MPSTTTAPATTTSSAAVSTSGTVTTVPPTAAAQVETGDLVGFDLIEVSLSGRRLKVAVADEPGLRSRGLMGVVDLGDVDGMLFSWGGDVVSSRFIMRNTVIPLTIAFFGPDGRLVDVIEMVPCEADPCPTYGASGPYAYAIEFPAGFEVGADPVLEFSDGD